MQIDLSTLCKTKLLFVDLADVNATLSVCLFSCTRARVYTMGISGHKSRVNVLCSLEGLEIPTKRIPCDPLVQNTVVILPIETIVTYCKCV